MTSMRARERPGASVSPGFGVRDWDTERIRESDGQADVAGGRLVDRDARCGLRECRQREREWDPDAPHAHRHVAVPDGSALGISFAEYVRRVLDEDLGDPPPSPDATQIFGLFDSDSADVAKNKDAYVDEAVRANQPRSRGT